jgi:hypothetical protein
MARPEPLPVAVLDLTDERNRVVAYLRIATTSGISGPLYPLIRISADEALQWGEQRLQLLEGRTYDYALVNRPVGTHLRQGVFRASRLSDAVTDRGTIIP